MAEQDLVLGLNADFWKPPAKGQSTREIRHILSQAWSTFVWSQISHRKGVIDVPFDAYIQHKTLRSLSPTSLRLIALDLTGGFQTGAIKYKWDSTRELACPFCGQDDTHAHRLLHCPNFLHVRNNHQEAIAAWHAHHNLLWFPLATTHSQQIVYNRFKLHRAGPFLDHPPLVDCSVHTSVYTLMARVIVQRT